MNANGRAIGTNDSLAQTMSSEQQQYGELLDFKKEYQNGVRNVFIYAPERLHSRKLMAGSQNIAGAYYPTSPDQYTFSTLTGSKTRKLGENPKQITLDINYTILISYDLFADTSIGDFSTDVYFTVANLFSDSYIQTGIFEPFNITVEPLLVIYAGKFSWFKSTATYSFLNFNTSITLGNTIASRGTVDLFGNSYFDFTNYPDQLTADQYQQFIIQGNRPIAVATTFNADGMDFNNSAFFAGNFVGNVSYSFNYYALLANF